jgi:hypothetical protein
VGVLLQIERRGAVGAFLLPGLEEGLEEVDELDSGRLESALKVADPGRAEDRAEVGRAVRRSG